MREATDEARKSSENASRRQESRDEKHRADAAPNCCISTTLFRPSLGIADDVAFAARHGIHVLYGYLFDPRITSIGELKQELATVLESDVLMYPNYISLMTPLLGTKLFWDSAHRRELLPGLRLRDLDGETLAFRNTIDDVSALSAFAQVLYCKPERLAGRRRLLWKLLRYGVKFRVTNPVVWYVLYRNNVRAILQAKGYSRGRRNYIGGQDVLDAEYSQLPQGISESDRRTYFDFIVVSDEDGGAAEWLQSYDPLHSHAWPSARAEAVGLAVTSEGDRTLGGGAASIR